MTAPISVDRRGGETMGKGLAAILAAVALAALAACGGSPPPPAQATSRAVAAPECAGPGVHEQHLSRFACEVCHPAGARFGFDTPYTFPRGTSTAGGTIVLHTATAPTSCAVACHFPIGGAPRSVDWTTPGPLACTACHDLATLAPAHPAVSATATRADCQGCHDTSSHAVGTGAVVLVGHAPAWIDPASPDFHATSANRGLARCEQCHAQDLSGGPTGSSCARCHDGQDASGNAVSWKTRCTMCHGGANDATGAPPRTIWGQSADAVRVGAHASHVNGSAIAPPVDCAACHPKPADALASGHIDDIGPADVPLATVAFAGLATQGLAPRGIAPAWDRTTATCAGTYCHGATLSGGALTSPVWTTLDGSQAACGTCHGVPPPPPHPGVDPAAGTKACNTCHAATVDASGAIIAPAAGGKHLDGVLEAAGHADGWMDTASPAFHAYSADAGLAACQGCHGANLDGVGGTASTACGSCHDRNLPAGVASWRTNCVMCHGGAENRTGAPPRATWGNSGDPVRAGAHGAHVVPRAIAAGFACSACHVQPADALAPGHVDGPRATVVWSGLGVNPHTSPPTWDGASCSNTYCHGNFAGFVDPLYGAPVVGGKNAAPSWTGGPMTCTSCHDTPPSDHLVPQYGATVPWTSHSGCSTCHPSVDGSGTAIVNPAVHVNGVVDLNCSPCHG